MPPTFGNGKICYIVMPAADVAKSAAFYRVSFGWNVRTRSDGSVAFDDGVGEVSGTWAEGLPPLSQPGLTIHIMVDDMEATLALVAANGGEIVQTADQSAREITALFRDPGGNVLGLYQHGGRR
jgi:predicted enzyme related to lactoylglutathione lyase